jgi:hypothetical protein
MDDFASLNVTIDEVRFHLVDAANGSDGGETGDANGTMTTTVNGTMTATAAANETVTDATATNETATPTVTPEADEKADDAETEEADDEAKDEEAEDDESEAGDGRWVVRDGNETTVDLTTLRGDNATLVEEFDVPAGEYDRVVLDVSDVNATLTDGTDQRVKLPSGKLQLNTEFEVGADSEVDFVYDIMVHKAGNSGKYILRPVLSESGTDQPIDPVDKKGRPVDDDRADERDEADERYEDDEREDERDEEREDERADVEREGTLSIALQGQISAGENVTVRVTDDAGPVANGTVAVAGESVGTTDSDGRLTVTVPDAEELEIEVTAGDAEGELERDLGTDGSED